MNDTRDRLAEQYVYMHQRRTEGQSVKLECFKAGFDAGLEHGRQRSLKLVDALERIRDEEMDELTLIHFVDRIFKEYERNK